MVIFRNAEGKPGYHQADALDEAVKFVEHLRNSEQVTDARLFSMEEVPIEIKTYYKVEVVGAAEPVNASAPGADAGDPAGPAVVADPMTGEPLPVGAGAGTTRFGHFGRS